MSNWNEAFTRRKSKEMLAEAQEENKNIKRAPHHDIYANQHDFVTPALRRREQERKDKFAWKVGIFAITLISMVGIAAIWWAVIQ
jgi:hypothetical protein